MQTEHKTPSKITIRPTNTTPSTATTRSGSIPRPRQGGEESIETWEHKTLAGLFRLTLTPGRDRDSHGNKLHFALSVWDDLEAEKAEHRLTTSNVEQAILEAATASDHPLNYLLACWKRIIRLQRTFKTSSDSDPKVSIVKEAKRLCMSYCIFAATMPDMFGLNATERSPLAEHLLCDPEDDRGLCVDFLSEAVKRFEEDDMVKEALVSAMETLSRDLAKLSMNDSYKPYITVCLYTVFSPRIFAPIYFLLPFLAPLTFTHIVGPT